MKNPEFPGKPVENQTKETLKKPIETIPQDVNTIQDFFKNTKQGQEISIKMESLADYVLKNPIEIEDLRGMNTFSLVSIAKVYAAMGKPYGQYIDQAVEEATSDNIYNKHQILDHIIGFYRELNLPPDEHIEKILNVLKNKVDSEFQPQIQGMDIILRVQKYESHDYQFRQISNLYTNNGDFNKPYEIASYIKNTSEKDKHMLEISLKLGKDNPAREEVFSLVESKIINNFEDQENKYGNNAELYSLIDYFIKDGQIDRAFKLIDSLTMPDQKVYTLMSLVEPFVKENRPTDILFERAIKCAEDSEKYSADLYSGIIVGYLKIGDLANVSKLLLTKKVEYKAHFLDKIPTAVLLEPSVSEFFQSYIKEEKLLGNSHPHEDLAIKTLSRMGKFEEAIKFVENLEYSVGPGIKTEKHGKFISRDMESFVDGINENIQAVNSFKNNKISRFYSKDNFDNQIKKIFSANKIDDIFAMSYYFKNVVPNLDEYPEHIKIPAKLGIALRPDNKLSPYDMGELHNPLELRAFLRSMEHYDFKTTQDFLEKVFDVLPAEGDNVVYEYISQNPQSAPRLIKNIIDIDNTKGTQYAVNFISRRNVPDKLFSYFTYLCIENGRFSKNVEPLIKNPENMDSLRKLISQFPNQFNNVADVCEGLDITDLSKENDLWEALKDISPITPGIYAKYRKLNPREKIEFKEWLSKFDYSNFFKNEPMDLEKLSIEDREVIVDLLYRAYNPVNMSFTAVKELLETVPDRTKDLKEYKIRDVYPVNFKTVSFELKKEESLSIENLNKIKGFFEQKETADPQEPLLRLARATTDFTHEESLALFNLMNSNTQIAIQRNNWIESNNELGQPDSSSMKTFRALGSSKEYFGIFTEDNLPAAITNYLEQDPKLKERFLNIISRPERRINLLKALGYQEDNEFTKEIPTLGLMAQVFSEKVLSKYTILANKELRKYVKSEDVSTAVIPAKMYISKNQGSFFSKSSAGLCTAQDVKLWDRPNHFHINVVNEENQIKGLTMAYIENINNKKSLVLRGFNPTVQYLESTSPVSFVEESIGVAREFMKDNNIEDLYIIDNSGDRLSNRPAIVSYVSAYISNLEKVSHEMVIAGSDNKVSAVRKVVEE